MLGGPARFCTCLNPTYIVTQKENPKNKPVRLPSSSVAFSPALPCLISFIGKFLRAVRLLPLLKPSQKKKCAPEILLRLLRTGTNYLSSQMVLV